MKRSLTAKILEFIWENPGASLKEIASILGIGLPTTRSVLYKLKNNGYIEKAGKGYILTSKGEWFVRNILRKNTTVREESVQEQAETIEKEPVKEEAAPQIPAQKTMRSETAEILRGNTSTLDKLVDKVTMIEKRINTLEKSIEEIQRKIALITKKLTISVSENKKHIPKHMKNIHGKEAGEKPKLPSPIMHIQEAKNILGHQLDQLIRAGRVEVIGSIVVDSDYYKEFKKKFPLSIRDAEKLSVMEKRLLEEMNREAIVIIQAGKYYKLVK